MVNLYGEGDTHHIPDVNRKMERADENKRAATRSIFLGQCVKMPL